MRIDLAPLLHVSPDDEFVRRAYQLILGRDPDPFGLLNFTERLRNGASRQAVLAEMARSEEGRKSGRQFTGVDLGQHRQNWFRRASLKPRQWWKGFDGRVRPLVRGFLFHRFDVLDRKIEHLATSQSESFDELRRTIEDLRAAPLPPAPARIPLVVAGSGGHARVVVELLETDPAIEIRGCTSIEPTGVFAYPVLCSDEALPQLRREGVTHCFVAIGNNAVRARLLDEVQAMGYTLVNAISPKAVVSPRATLGRGIAIMAGAVVNAYSTLGDGVIVNTGATVDHDCVLGRAVHIAPGTNLAGTVRVGDGTLLGVGSRVIPGISIGRNAVVAAGSVVTKDVPDGVMVAGVPAVVKKQAVLAGAP